ncbi:hypothetical protein FA09DRAFT_340581 [Tilletiopsis washingtonensis]|uniref:Uncharacterized protein n=1 Tax=Tilletiopsis washingtonensis TaxID=58919 RepID=A0A316Z4Z5_9BASI|nr:hypothetical protein FA09DRAFT_340581 [Tilletiopsis washingtonensis]PWN96012.1 hypothetical protein FA09DRAFT_340581 [Tilletiopsis washingtonensis]
MSDAGTDAWTDSVSEASGDARHDKHMEVERSEMLLEDVARSGERYLRAQRAFSLAFAADSDASKAASTAAKSDTTAYLAARQSHVETVRARKQAIHELHAAAESLGRRISRLAIDVDDQDDWASLLNFVPSSSERADSAELDVPSPSDSETSSCATSEEEADEEEQKTRCKPKTAVEKREEMIEELFPGPTALLRLISKRETNKRGGKKGTRRLHGARRTANDELSSTIASEEDFNERMVDEDVKYPWDFGPRSEAPTPRISEMLRARRWMPRP